MTAEPESWTGDRVAGWLRRADGLDRQLAGVSDLLFEAARLEPGEAVLDVGCGTGPTTRRAAALVGPAGRVSGLDVSPDMLAAAAGVPTTGPAAAIEWVAADLVAWDPPPAAYDVAISRFGVMFFADPGAAMTTLASGVRPGGRLAFAVWGPRGRSPLFEVPYSAVLDTLAARGVTPVHQPPDEGPFSWHDAERVGALLRSAAWSDVEVRPAVLPMRFAGGLGPQDAADSALDFGPTRTVLEGADEETRAAARDAVAAALAAYVVGGEVVLDGEVRVITARR